MEDILRLDYTLMGKKITSKVLGIGDCTRYVTVKVVYKNGFVGTTSWSDCEFVYYFSNSPSGGSYNWVEWNPTIIDFTMDEIAEMLGIPVEQLKIKK